MDRSNSYKELSKKQNPDLSSPKTQPIPVDLFRNFHPKVPFFPKTQKFLKGILLYKLIFDFEKSAHFVSRSVLESI